MSRRRSLIVATVTAGCWIALLAIVLNSVFGARKLAKQLRSKERQSAHPTNKPAKIPHGTTASPDSLSTASQTRFATGTGTKYRGVRDRHFQGRFLTLGRGRIDQRHFAPQYDRHLASTRRARESSLIGTTVGAYWAERMANMCFPSLSVNTT